MSSTGATEDKAGSGEPRSSRIGIGKIVVLSFALLDALDWALHESRTMRMVPHVSRRPFSEESKKKLWRPCREARALGL